MTEKKLMSDVRAFLDTNIFVYLYSGTEPNKCMRISSTINAYHRMVSTQVLNEFCNVCIRKMKLPVSFIENAVEEICDTCELLDVDDTTIVKALNMHEKYGYAYYDSLIIASALEGQCRYLFSEDMADGQRIEEQLTIKNILVHDNTPIEEDFMKNESERYLYELREKGRRDFDSAIITAEKRGKVAGKDERNLEVAHTMLAKNMSLELTAEITGLSLDELKTLRKG